VLVSEWATYDLLFSLPKITGMVLGIAVFFAVVRIGKTTQGWWLSLLAFLGVGLSFALFGLVGTRWGAKVSALSFFAERLVLRIKGIPGIEEGLNPNQLAGALTWVLPVLIVLSGLVLADRRALLEGFGRRVRTAIAVVVFSSAALVLFTFVLTASRSAYIGFAVAMLVVTWAIASRRWRRLLLIVPVIGLIGAGILLWQGALGGVSEELFGGAVTNSPAFSLHTLEGRLELWSRAIYGIQDFPFTGMGIGAFRHVVHVLYPLFLTSPDVDIGHAHNEFLQAALDLGIPGLVAFVALYFGALGMLWSIWASDWNSPGAEGGASDRMLGRQLSRPVARLLAVGLGGGLLAHLLYGLTDAVALGAKPGVLFWMLLGLIVGLYELRGRKVDSEPMADGPSEATTLAAG
jgi:putative inorganic carbon (HCO3(-)) transporter